jgi:predicted nucleic acid-binding protein
VIAYIDSSVLLRIVFAQPGRLKEWRRIDLAVTSALTEVECLRTLDRRTRQDPLEEKDLPARRGLVIQLLERMERIDLGPSVLRRAAEAFPTPLGNLDAIHMASALLWATARGEAPVMATHDAQLAAAARSMGLAIIGT